MMRIRLEQLNPVVADLEGNRALILNSLERAQNDEIDLLILPEMVLIGYPAQDVLEFESFREQCYQANREIIELTKQTALLFGTITPNESSGRKMYNSALLARHGELLGTAHKTLLPTYDVFDDLRYFEPNQEFDCLELDGRKLGVTICEDIWYNENEVQYHTYDTDPAHLLSKKGAEVIINISASPFTVTKHENRFQMLKNHAVKLKLPVLYSNQVGAHTEILFDGDSAALNSEGDVVGSVELFEPSFVDLEWHRNGKELIKTREGKTKSYPKTRPERFFRAIIMGIRDYIYKLKVADEVVLGLSGGIDSALVCVLAAEALGPEKVHALTMPSQFSSSGSISDSEKLANRLGVNLHEVAIEPVFEQFMGQLDPVFGDTEFGVAEENLQSRIRGTLLMAAANKFGYFLLATGNKSEYAVGYATLYGDMNGALAVIGDLYKTEVYELAKWLNEEYYGEQVIPESILEKPPSAELRPDQKDTDTLPEYEVLDDILYRYIELQESAGKIIDSGHNEEIVKRIMSMVDANEFKRYQAAPILKVSSKSFGIGRRIPIVKKWRHNEP
jgi:NAD+ synthetase